MKRRIIILFCLGLSVSLFSQHVLKVATFNIQNFGKSKLSKTTLVDTLSAIVRQFDIVAVQEISDKSNSVATAFLKKINMAGQYHYKVSTSKRTGEQADDKSKQEQYAFYYNSDVVTLTNALLYDDSKHDYFDREPYIAKFSTKQDDFSFIICTIHTVPEYAVEEIGALIHVAKWIPTKFNSSDNIIFCGDFNASCSYASPEQLEQLAIHKQPYNWIVPDTIKTNLSKKTCAYDRFVVTDTLLPKIKGYEVLHYFKSNKVSDHWPVFIKIIY